MGSGSSRLTVCSTDNILLMLRVLRDAHDVTVFYAELLLAESLPVSLEYYKNYNKETEEFFNKTRKIKRPEIDMSFYKFYTQLANFKKIYELSENTALIRKSMLVDIFTTSYLIQSLLIQDLYDMCLSG